MYGFPVGAGIGWLMYYVNTRFAGYVTSRGKGGGGAVALLVSVKYVLLLATLAGAGWLCVDVMLFTAGGVLAALIGLALVRARRAAGHIPFER